MAVTFSLADGTATGRQEILSVSGSLDSTAISSMRSRLARVSPGCDGVCIDTNWDSNNCGACGYQCGPLEFCSWGFCYGSGG